METKEVGIKTIWSDTPPIKRGWGRGNFPSPPAPLAQGRGEQNSLILQFLETHKQPFCFIVRNFDWMIVSLEFSFNRQTIQNFVAYATMIRLEQ